MVIQSNHLELERGHGVEVLADVPCTWSPESEDACGYCSGEACARCLGILGVVCEHDVAERHEYPVRRS